MEVLRFLKALAFGGLLILGPVGCQMANAPLNDSDGSALPADLEDGIPITGIRPDFFKHARFITENTPQTGFWLRSVRECYAVPQQRFVAVAEEMQDTVYSGRRWFFHYEGVQYPNGSPLLTREGQPQALFSQVSSQPSFSEQASMLSNIEIASVATIPQNDQQNVHQQITETWSAGPYQWVITPGGSISSVAVGTSWLSLSDLGLRQKAGWNSSQQYFSQCRLDSLSELNPP
jgi:hypothetical protein